METKERNLRTMLLILPLLVLPFLALAFYGLGGGKGSAPEQIPLAGINTNLPDAQFKKDDAQDKLSLYSLLAKDSSAFKDQFGELQQDKKAEIPPLYNGPEGSAEEKITEKLALIEKEINRPERPVKEDKITTAPVAPVSLSKDVDRLENLMYTLQEGKEEDPEMAQLSAMLDKIIKIQNPEISREEVKVPSDTAPDSLFRTISAEISRKQKVVTGSTVELRLLDSVMIGGYLIPMGHALFGTCRITNQRLLLDIRNVRLGTSIIPVNLTVYSLDGMPGIDAPEAVLGDAARSGTDNAVRGIGMYGMDQSIVSKVAGAGIDAARDLASKKVKKIRVKLSQGARVLLRNNESVKH